MSDRTLFNGPIANGVTKYVEVPVHKGALGAQIAWKDATSAATITLETSSMDIADPTVAGAAWEWTPTSVTITGPDGTAVGSTALNVENVRQGRARFKIVATADCDLEIRDGARDGNDWW